MNFCKYQSLNWPPKLRLSRELLPKGTVRLWWSALQLAIKLRATRSNGNRAKDRVVTSIVCAKSDKGACVFEDGGDEKGEQKSKRRSGAVSCVVATNTHFALRRFISVEYV